MTKHQKGFSLIELTTVLLILSILVTLSVATSKMLLVENRTTSAVNTLLSGLYYARNESIQRGEKITFCKSKNKESCSGDWSDGQIIVNSKGEVLRVFGALPASDKLIWLSGLGRNDVLEWLPTGYTNGQRGSFYYCAHKRVEMSRVIVVLNTGRLYTSDMEYADYERVCGSLRE